MKVTVNEECIGCGLCESTAADVFAINDDGVDIEFETSEIKSVKEVYSEQESA